MDGPLPTKWPKAAMKGDPLPKGAPVPPIKGLDLSRMRWNSSGTPGGSNQYWISWYIKEDFKSLTARLNKSVEGSKAWNMPRGDHRSAHAYPKKPTNGLVWMDASDTSSPANTIETPGWSVISISWVEPKSIPEWTKRNFKAAR